MPKVKANGVKLQDIYSGEFTTVISRERRITLALQDVREVIYGIRTFDDLIKIGYTTNMAGRMRYYGLNMSNTHRILFARSGTPEEERAVHGLLRPHLARGREYYHPTPEVIQFINFVRDGLGVAPIAA